MNTGIKFTLIIFVFLFLIASSCKKDKAAPPVIENTYVIDVSYTNAASGATITDDGGTPVLARGVCWNCTGEPTIDNDKTVDGFGTGSFKSKVEKLTPGTLYYLRAYATNSAGTAYDEQQSFTTESTTNPSTVTDIEGNVYNTVVIGNQTWMKENLKTTKYRNTTDIPQVTGITEWFLLTTPSYNWYDNDVNNKNTYGALYNWFTIEMGKTPDKSICPFGWHVPTDAEWSVLASNLHWNNPDSVALDKSGFNAVRAGARSSGGSFYGKGEFGQWWSSTAVAAGGAWSWCLGDTTGGTRLGRFNQYGLSVRCLKDN
jgi:uncharacterized protein (TIGR02145 family)